MENELKIGGIYRHFKGNDKLYKIEKIAINSETLEEWVVYTALYGDKKTWIRPKYMFLRRFLMEKKIQIIKNIDLST